MTLDEIRAAVAELFPIAVRNATESTEFNAEFEQIRQMCWVHHRRLGFDCMFSCFDAVMPTTEGELSLSAWSSKELCVAPWTFRVRCRPFFLSEHHAHLEIHHEGPLPNVTETGYRAMFEPLSTFSKISPENFVRSQICRDLPQSRQMQLF